MKAKSVTGEERMIHFGSGSQGVEEASWDLGETLAVLCESEYCMEE